MEGFQQLYDNFRANFEGLGDARRSEVLLYALAVKLAKFEEFKKRERAAFEMVKNLFTLPGHFNKEQLELFYASFVQNTQACMGALEKGGSEAQLRDMENKLFASLLWALTFGAGVEGDCKAGVEELWRALITHRKGLKEALQWVEQTLSLEENKLVLFRRAAIMDEQEMMPQLSL